MHYSTHAVSPLLAIADSRAKAVHCFGSGVMRDDLHKQYNNPYPIETAIFELEQPGLAAEVTRSLFQTARSYTESFTVYGEKASFEWQIESEDPIIFRQKKHTQDVNGQPGRGLVYSTERVQMPNYADKLPSSIRNFTVKGEFDDLNPQKPAKGGGHHGSHPHLVHEFIRSIVENRRPWIDEIRGADWTAAGICAHESAINGGKKVEIPDFRY